MSRRSSIVTMIVVVVLAVVVIAPAIQLVMLLRSGLTTHVAPTRMEEWIARTIRHFAVPSDLRGRENPMPFTPAVLDSAIPHYADHCAVCHGDDGKGKTLIGERVYPRVPDMTQSRTQSLSDGELFAIIENGVRLTGMPGWGEGTAASAKGSWELVHLIRHLPRLTPKQIDGIKRLNPRSPAGGEETTEGHNH